MSFTLSLKEFFARRPYRRLTPQRPQGKGELFQLLYSVIMDYQTATRLRTGDYSFDAFQHLAEKFGHRNPSTIRKMCEPRESNNGAKLGFEEVIIVIRETQDFRLYEFFREEITHPAPGKARLPI